MRSLSIFAIAVLLQLPAFAQTSSEVRPLDVTGQVPGTCTLGAPPLEVRAHWRTVPAAGLPETSSGPAPTLVTKPSKRTSRRPRPMPPPVE